MIFRKKEQFLRSLATDAKIASLAQFVQKINFGGSIKGVALPNHVKTFDF